MIAWLHDFFVNISEVCNIVETHMSYSYGDEGSWICWTKWVDIPQRQVIVCIRIYNNNSGRQASDRILPKI